MTSYYICKIPLQLLFFLLGKFYDTWKCIPILPEIGVHISLLQYKCVFNTVSDLTDSACIQLIHKEFLTLLTGKNRPVSALVWGHKHPSHCSFLIFSDCLVLVAKSCEHIYFALSRYLAWDLVGWHVREPENMFLMPSTWELATLLIQ